MKMQNIRRLPHVPQRPVTVERDGTDRLIIEGIPYAADIFRFVALPDDQVLVAIRKNAEGVVELKEIRNLEDAKKFFEEAKHAL